MKYTSLFTYTTTSRRNFLSLPALFLFGCISDDEPADEGSEDKPGDQRDGEQDTKNDKVPGLESKLKGLYQAENRTSYASENGIELNNGRALVVVELETGSELPSGIDAEVRSRHEGSVEAYVAVDDLVTLAKQDRVNLVREPRQPLPDDGSDMT